MKSYKNSEFHKWAIKCGITDAILLDVIQEMNQGGYEANLGGNIYKKRIAIGSKGKSGGVRTILAFKAEDKAFFIYGFSKNKKANVDDRELKALKKLANIYLNLSDEEITRSVLREELIEIEVHNG